MTDFSVLIAMSGGVDSAAAAYLLKKRYTVAGVTMQLGAEGSAHREAACLDIADAAVKEAVKKIRENALEEAKKIVGERFDAQMKAYKEAVARMKDEKQKNRAGRMIARMEENRDRIVTGRAAMMLMPEGRRPGFGGPEGRRPMMPPRPEKAPAAK